MIIANEFSCYIDIKIIIYSGVRTHIVCYFTGCTGFDSLLFHGFLESFLVNAVAFFLKDLLCEVKRESVSIIKFECIVTGKSFLAGFLHILFHVGKDAETLIDGLVKLILLVCKNTEDKLFLLLKFRITGFGALDHLCA